MENREQTSLTAWRSKALLVGLVASALSVVGLFTDRGQFFQSYLLAFIFWLGLAGGCLGFLMIQHLVIARWGMVIQRILEAGARTLPFFALLFIPIALGMHSLYEWTDPEVMAESSILQDKAAYLNVHGFLLRAVAYFVIWTLLATLLTRWSRRLDETGDLRFKARMANLSAGGLILYGLSATFASFDWMMSLEPHWFSTIYGALFLIGQGICGLALSAFVLHRVADRPELKNLVTPQQFHDVGNLLFAFIILWAYMSFGQFLIIWSGNLHEETVWYLDRRYGGWVWVSVVLLFANFLLPFLCLLVKSNKRRSAVLSAIATWVILSRLIDIHWKIAPTFHPAFHVSWMDVSLVIGLGGLWVSQFLRLLEQRHLVSLKDPRYEPLFGTSPEEHAS